MLHRVLNKPWSYSTVKINTVFGHVKTNHATYYDDQAQGFEV